MKGELSDELCWTDSLSGSSYRTGVSTATDGWGGGRGQKGVVFNHFNKYRSLSNEVRLIDRVEARDIHTQHSALNHRCCHCCCCCCCWHAECRHQQSTTTVDSSASPLRAELTNCVRLSVRLRPAGLFTCRARFSSGNALLKRLY